MQQPQPHLSTRDDELLRSGLAAIADAYANGLITLKERIRLSQEWSSLVLDEPDEMLEGAYADEYLDS
ncbi:MAG TPA: hypothetical protein VH599_07220 [Ktedonobacterales bacterium]|jgi:hypothetical protein